jgi:DNA polymerase-3 subunit gamma/tau
MSYEVTASKKRPQDFDSVVGQDFVVSTLKSSLELGRIAHAYLFSGPRGVGKTSAARILAKALNCENGPTVEPCGHCSLCSEIARGNSLDVIEIDGASNTSVNDIRELKDEVLFAPNSGRYKIYIIDEVHMLSNSAFNALLKTIEEPPPYIVFIFATTEVHKVPATIRSRCQQFNFRLIPVETIKEQLRETTAELGLEAEEEALFWIAKEATGSLRDAYTLFDQIASFSQNGINLSEIQEKLGLVGTEAINDIAESMADEDGTAVISKAEEIFAQGVAIEQFVIDLAEYFRNILFLIHGVERESILGYPAASFSQKVRQAFSSDQIEYALERLFGLYRNLRFSLNQRFETELVLSDLSALPKRISPSALIDRIDGLKHELLSGEASARPAPAPSTAGSAPTAPSPDSTPTGGSAAGSPAAASQETAGPAAGSPAAAGPAAGSPGSAGSASAPPSGSNAPDAGASAAGDSAAEAAARSAARSSEHTAAPQQAAEPEPRKSGRRRLGSEEVEQLVTGLKSRPSLAAAVQKVVDWQLDDEQLVVTCDSTYSANKLRDEKPTIVSLVAHVIGKKLDIRVKTAGEKEEERDEQHIDEQAELVKKVFRGHIVGNGVENESDGSV